MQLYQNSDVIIKLQSIKGLKEGWLTGGPANPGDPGDPCGPWSP